MYYYEKNIDQTAKISGKGVVGLIFLALLPIVAIFMMGTYMEPSLQLEFLKMGMAVVSGIILMYLFHRLLCNRLWFDVNDPEYQTEYIRLGMDYIEIYSRLPSYQGHEYSKALIYFSDISHSFIYGKGPNKGQRMVIYTNRNLSGKSTIPDTSNRKGIITEYMYGYSPELCNRLRSEYKQLMKLR